MSKDITYFVASGRSLEIIEAYVAAVEAHVLHTNAIAERLGATGCFRYSDHRFAGFSFPLDVDVPEGLRRDKKQPTLCEPDRRRKVGQAIETELEMAKCPSHWMITHELMGGPALLGPSERGHGVVTGLVSFEKIGDNFIIGVPHLPDGEPKDLPPDAVALKKSEYWARKEAAEGDPAAPSPA